MGLDRKNVEGVDRKDIEGAEEVHRMWPGLERISHKEMMDKLGGLFSLAC